MNGMSGGFPTNQVNPTDNIIKGAGVPIVSPANPLITNLYIDTTTNPELITHWWNQGTSQWESLGVPSSGNVRFGTTAPTVLITDKENDTYVWSTNGTSTGQALRIYTFDKTSNTWVLTSQRSNVAFGSTIPTALLTDNENDTYIRTSDGTPTGTILGTYVYDQTSNAWYLQAATVTLDGNHIPILRSDAIVGIAPTALEIPSPIIGDSASIKLTSGDEEMWKYNGTWVLTYTNTPAVLDGNNVPIVRSNATAGVAPTVAEIPTANLVNGDSADVYLTNGNKEVWLYNGIAWALVTTVLPTTLDGNHTPVLRVTATPSVAPTIIEIPLPILGDTASIKLSNGNEEFYKYSGSAWLLVYTNIQAAKIFRIVQTLLASPTVNIINHNLGLATPFTTIVETRDNATGALVATRVTIETTNTLAITVPVAQTGVRITILG
jgi:hypothetical protein